jgi:hypothetical protein
MRRSGGRHLRLLAGLRLVSFVPPGTEPARDCIVVAFDRPAELTQAIDRRPSLALDALARRGQTRFRRLSVVRGIE